MKALVSEQRLSDRAADARFTRLRARPHRPEGGTARRDTPGFHYALRIWNKARQGSWHLYGHSHGSLADDPHARSMDVGVDCNDFRPFSFEEVAQHMRSKHYRPVDCHVPEGYRG